MAMLSLNSAWEILSAMVGIGGALLVAFRFSLVTMLRQSNEDLRDRVEELDRELARFRELNREQSVAIDELTKHAAAADNRVTELAAFGHADHRYIERLEKLCQNNSLKLPHRDRLGGELGE